MTWYKAAQDEQLEQIASDLIDAVWNMGVLDEEDKYLGRQVSMIIDNDQPLSQMVMQFGEDAEDRIKEFVEEELIERQQREQFDPRQEELMSIEGDLPHIQEIIRGLNWEDAKRALMDMGPGGAFHDPDHFVEEEYADRVFNKLWSANAHGSFLGEEILRSDSPFVSENGDKILKRLSEIRAHSHEETQNNKNLYEETQIYRALFGAGPMPEKIRVFRGVSRADADIRPGDYTTPSRDYANSYLRGEYGAVINDIVNVDDLTIGTTNVGYSEVELVYYPRGYQEEVKQEDTPQMTFRGFWEKVNELV